MPKQNESDNERRHHIISLAAERWARRHNIKAQELETRAVKSCIGNPYIARERIDARRGRFIWDEKQDLLIRRGTRWLLSHCFDSLVYQEHRNGHAKLFIKKAHLPETVLATLYRSQSPLSSIVKMPRRCPINAANPRIIRAVTKKDGLELLLRIDWRTID